MKILTVGTDPGNQGLKLGDKKIPTTLTYSRGGLVGYPTNKTTNIHHQYINSV